MTDREKVLDLRLKGVSRLDIATQLDLTVHQVNVAIETAMIELRDGAPLVVEEMYHVHHERLENLFRLVQKRIDEMTDFDSDVFKIALSILERQSKLHGLDKNDKKKTRVGSSSREADWLDKATPSELIHEAQTYGFNVPEKFKVD